MTGDSIQELYAGAGQYGVSLINNVVEDALKKKQRIIWYPDPSADPRLGLVLYRLQSL